MSIPAGCQTEDTVTLKGLGVTNIRNKDGRGNLAAHVNVYSHQLNETERGLIRQFAASARDSGAARLPRAPVTGRSKKGFFRQVEGRTELRTGFGKCPRAGVGAEQKLFSF